MTGATTLDVLRYRLPGGRPDDGMRRTVLGVPVGGGNHKVASHVQTSRVRSAWFWRSTSAVTGNVGGSRPPL